MSFLIGQLFQSLAIIQLHALSLLQKNASNKKSILSIYVPKDTSHLVP